MRLDEHGRWVSDDGAYVWDEAAQTWRPSSAAPPASSGGSAAWPPAGGAGVASSGPATGGAVAPTGGAGPGSGVPRSAAGQAGAGPAAAPGGAAAPGAGAGSGVPSAYGGTGQFGRWGLTGGQVRVDTAGSSAGSPRVTAPTAATALGAAGAEALGGQPGLRGQPLPEGQPGLRGQAVPGGQPGLRGRPEPGGQPMAAGQPGRGAVGSPGALGSLGAVEEDDLDPGGELWDDGDGESTGEIRRATGPMGAGAPPARVAGVAHWDDDLDDEMDGDAAPGLDDEDDDGPVEPGWAPSGGRVPERGSRPAAGGGGFGGLLRGVRDRPPVLIGAIVVLVCVGLGIAGFLALGGGGSDGGSPSGASAAGRGVYDKSVRDAYLSSCLDVSNGNEGYCTCTLDKLEATYTQEEYQRFSANVQSASSQRIVREIYAACRDKR